MISGRYRKRPIVIGAIKWEGDGISLIAVIDMAPDASIQLMTDRSLAINTLEGTMYASVGDWIIRGVKGELYPCKPDIFDATYEAVE